MKKFKKVLLALVASVTCFSMVSMTACDSASDDSTSQEKTIEKIVEAVSAQDIGGFGGTLTIDETMVIDSPSVYYSIASYDIDATLSFDLTKGQMDGFITGVSKDKQYSGSDYSNKSKGLTGATQSTTYETGFLRDGHALSVNSTTKLSKYDSTVTLTASESLDASSAVLQSVISGLSSASASEESVDVGSITSAAIQLGEKYDAVTVSSSQIKVDGKNLVKGLYNDVITVVNSLTGTTTVLQVLQNDTIKNLITTATNELDAKDIYNQLKAQLSSEEYATILNSIPEPTDGQSFYEYIISIVNSKTFSELVLGANKGTIGNMTLDSILGSISAGLTVDSIKQMITSMVTLTESDGAVVLTVNATGTTTTVKIKTAEFVFDLDKDYTISKISANYEITTITTVSANSALSSYNASNTLDMSVKVEVTPYTTKNVPALTDISACKVEYNETIYDSYAKFLAAVK